MLRNHDAKALWQADLDHCIHPWTDFSDWPRTGSTIMVRGEGAHVWNAEGEKFIDGNRRAVVRQRRLRPAGAD